MLIRDLREGDVIISDDREYTAELVSRVVLRSYDGEIVEYLYTFEASGGWVFTLRGRELDQPCTVIDGTCEDCGKPVLDGENGVYDPDSGICYCEACVEKAEQEAMADFYREADVQREMVAWLASQDDDPLARMREATMECPPF